MAGVLAGAAVGFLQIFLQGNFDLTLLPAHTPLSVVLFASGALLGDIGKSFFKRRLGKERGANWPLADQYDLVIGAFLMAAVFDFPWLVSVMTLPVLVVILIITPLLHRR
jgi:CDP-2,3-bis-(O-geranylgeranyl)-sn-glycerol synthase